MAVLWGRRGGMVLEDEYWKVRLNALFAGGDEGVQVGVEDENAVVRVVAVLLAG